MAIELAKQGANLSLSDINETALAETSKYLRLSHSFPAQEILKATGITDNVNTFHCDVSSRDSVAQAGSKARYKFGEVTILINNAGIVSGKKILENSEAMMEKTIAVNTTAHLYTIREFLPAMIESKKGHIVSIASVAGTAAIAGMADYCASKFGAFAIDESLRMEMRHMGLYDKIKTTCICPYYINTGMFDGVKTTALFPILDQHYVTNRIVNAIR